MLDAKPETIFVSFSYEDAYNSNMRTDTSQRSKRFRRSRLFAACRRCCKVLLELTSIMAVVGWEQLLKPSLAGLQLAWLIEVCCNGSMYNIIRGDIA